MLAISRHVDWLAPVGIGKVLVRPELDQSLDGSPARLRANFAPAQSVQALLARVRKNKTRAQFCSDRCFRRPLIFLIPAFWHGSGTGYSADDVVMDSG
jgi:hypothetical protein